MVDSTRMGHMQECFPNFVSGMEMYIVNTEGVMIYVTGHTIQFRPHQLAPIQLISRPVPLSLAVRVKICSSVSTTISEISRLTLSSSSFPSICRRRLLSCEKEFIRC